jgi:predicted Zn-dependent protease with MMP-like domain
VEEAFDSLPEELLGFVDNVVFLVEDWPDHETLASLGIFRRDGLLGLYQGHPLPERDSHLTGALPDRVVLFQRPIERHASQMGLPVVDVVRDTLLHEVGHHFGLSEADLARLERES